MEEQYSRTALLVGADGVARLRQARVAVFGVGGVGGYAVEALARAGVGALDLIDKDVVSPSNLNRQIIATHRTLGQPKVLAAQARVADIDPTIQVRTYETFFLPETADSFDFSNFDYVIDAVDTVTAKLLLVEKAKAANVPILSCMGAGNKLDATAFTVTDIGKTTMCPLARIMRKELRKRGINHLKVVYSTEEAKTPLNTTPDPESGKVTPGSMPYVPGVAGLIAAGEVIRDLAAN